MRNLLAYISISYPYSYIKCFYTPKKSIFGTKKKSHRRKYIYVRAINGARTRAVHSLTPTRAPLTSLPPPNGYKNVTKKNLPAEPRAETIARIYKFNRIAPSEIHAPHHTPPPERLLTCAQVILRKIKIKNKKSYMCKKSEIIIMKIFQKFAEK